MKRINDMLKNEIYINELRKIEEAEKDRKFCRHTLEHFIDTARIAYILCLENGIDIKKDVIYAAALLHDIGRYRQYKYGIPHEKAGVEIARGLTEAFNEDEKKLIFDMISEHNELKSGLTELFGRADKLSRLCFKCSSYGECYWNYEEKNNLLKY